ncbi:putative pentatricopeptide repeat-containing protein At3g15200 [Phragmites australis]|uniref:putative pentatricopeptide repeat-containing protein At3g15200 n=1 Tax=Phragmites australis TaxID=29695 RepID=UPI002D79C662|nr:putative pentatricopeptide repeat-containing protein At3g15200 [Phragmites australis]
MPPQRLESAILSAACRFSKPLALLRRLGVIGSSRPPTVRHNASVGLPPLFRQGVLPSGRVLGPLRFFHVGSSEGSWDVYVSEVLRILKSSGGNDAELGDALSQFADEMDEDVVLKVLQKQRSNWQVALAFFNWVAGLPGYTHGSRAYTEMLDILGRMKKVRHMRELFDEIPEERRGVVVTNRIFAVLLNRYAGAHKVQEAIEVFYKRKDYGFEVDLVGFQILLMSLCRYKHVEEAEALFRQKKDDFPHVIKSWNIILNGWCVKGSLRDAQRIWNEIIASKLRPDLFTYGTFINALTKDGRTSAAVKLFNNMWEKGINPDVAICNCIIDQLCFKKKIPEALEIFGEMNDRRCQADVATYNTLIKHLCKIKRMEKVYELLDEMEAKGCSPNNRTYSYILKMSEKPKDVIALMQRMEESSVKLDSDTYNLILNLYVSWKYEKGMQQVWDEMERSGSGPDQRSFTIMVHGLHSQGKLDEALQYYTTMKSRGLIPEPRTRILVKAIHMKKDGFATEDQPPSMAGKNLKLDPRSRQFHVHK